MDVTYWDDCMWHSNIAMGRMHPIEAGVMPRVTHCSKKLLALLLQTNPHCCKVCNSQSSLHSVQFYSVTLNPQCKVQSHFVLHRNYWLILQTNPHCTVGLFFNTALCNPKSSVQSYIALDLIFGIQDRAAKYLKFYAHHSTAVHWLDL